MPPSRQHVGLECQSIFWFYCAVFTSLFHVKHTVAFRYFHRGKLLTVTVHLFARWLLLTQRAEKRKRRLERLEQRPNYFDTDTTKSSADLQNVKESWKCAGVAVRALYATGKPSYCFVSSSSTTTTASVSRSPSASPTASKPRGVKMESKQPQTESESVNGNLDELRSILSIAQANVTAKLTVESSQTRFTTAWADLFHVLGVVQ